MRSLTWFLFLSAGMIAAMAAGLSTPARADSYSLPALIQLVENNSKEVRLARTARKSAAAEKLAAFSAALPNVNLNLGYNRNFQENIFFFEVSDPLTGELQRGSFKTSFRNEYRLNATLEQTLFNFKVGYAIQAARYFNRFTDYQFEATRQDVVTRAKRAFYQVLLLEKVYAVAQESENNAKENYENIRTKYESGLQSEFSLLQAEVNWQNAVPATIKARRDYQTALNQLKVMAGIPLEEEITLNGSLEVFPPLPEGASFTEVVSRRPDYNALLWEKKLRQKNVSAQFAEHLPTLDAQLTYAYTAASDQFRLERDNDNVFLGLSLKVPIFSGGNTTAQVRKARAEVERVSTQIAMADDNIRIELENIRLNLKEAWERIEAARKGVQTARRAFEIAEIRVENNLATQLEMNDSRVSLERAQVNYYLAVFDYLSAYFEWEKATGNVAFNGI